MNDRFHDQTLHCVIHLAASGARYPVSTLHQAVKGFTVECLQPAINRGWVELTTGGKGASIVQITDDGEKWLRKLCDLSNEQPAIKI